MAKMIDAQCNVEFATEADYLKHKKAGHVGGMEKSIPIDAPPAPSLPPGVPPEAAPSAEFMEQVARIESGPTTPVTETPKGSQHPSSLPEAAPLVLTYKYTGECPDHRSPVDTLELDVAKTHFCIAYCPSGKHQIESKEVAKL